MGLMDNCHLILTDLPTSTEERLKGVIIPLS